jgi:hypothetical protein
MGFSEEEIAAQEAREQSARSGGKETTGTTSQAQRLQEQSTPPQGTGAVGEPTVPHAKADGIVPQKPTSASPVADPDSH